MILLNRWEMERGCDRQVGVIGIFEGTLLSISI
jgi:hypothetical protein